ncbi:unnamed protein product, partial [Brassica rapa subsp. trilocularis]
PLLLFAFFFFFLTWLSVHLCSLFSVSSSIFSVSSALFSLFTVFSRRFNSTFRYNFIIIPRFLT